MIRLIFTAMIIVNVDPSKSTILFHNKQLVYNLVEKVLDHAYPSKIDTFFKPQPQREWNEGRRRLINIDPEEETDNEEPHYPAFLDKENTPESPVLPVAEEEEQQLTTPAERTSASPIQAENMDRSFTFSMLSEDDEDTDENVSSVLSQSDNIPNQKDNVKKTLIDHWQIDDTESIATQVLPIVSVPVPHKSTHNAPLQQESHPIHSPFNFTSSTVKKTPSIQQTPSSTALPKKEQPPITPIRGPVSDLLKNKRVLEQQNSNEAITKKLKTMDLSPKELCRTLNQTQTLHCSLDKIASNYKRKSDATKYRVRMEDCLFKQEGGPITSIMRFSKLSKYDASLYTRGIKEESVNEIGAIKLKLYVSIKREKGAN